MKKSFAATWLCLIIAWLLSLNGVATPARAADRPARPNLVIILTDDMGYGDIEPFGSKVNRTPNLNRMAREGMKLTSFYCAPVCTPSRAQLLTGCYAKRVSLPVVIFKFALSPYEDWQRMAWAGALLVTATVLALSITARLLEKKRDHAP